MSEDFRSGRMWVQGGGDKGGSKDPETTVWELSLGDGDRCPVTAVGGTNSQARSSRGLEARLRRQEFVNGQGLLKFMIMLTFDWREGRPVAMICFSFL